jgi:hypothetical protein
MNNNEMLNHLYDFLNENHSKLLEEWERIKDEAKMTYPAFCVAYYSTLIDKSEGSKKTQ